MLAAVADRIAGLVVVHAACCVGRSECADRVGRLVTLADAIEAGD